MRTTLVLPIETLSSASPEDIPLAPLWILSSPPEVPGRLMRLPSEGIQKGQPPFTRRLILLPAKKNRRSFSLGPGSL